MNSETVRPMPPHCFSKRRNEISVTPAIGESTSGGLISMSRILKGLISLIRKPHEILTHVASMLDLRCVAVARPLGRASLSRYAPSLTVGLLPDYQFTTNF